MVSSPRCTILALLVSLVWHPAGAQNVSPLEQVMSTSSLISTPQVFRDMQSDILKKAQGVTPGLHLDDFYKDMSDARTIFLKKIHDARLIVSPVEDKLLLKLGSTGLSVSIPLKKDAGKLTVASVIDLIKAESSRTLEQYLSTELDNVFSGTQQEAITAALFRTLNASGLSTQSYSASSRAEYVRGIANILVDFVAEQARLRIRASGAEATLNSVLDKNLEGLCTELTTRFNAEADELEQKILRALDRAEYVVKDAMSQASNMLIRGNTGIAVSKGSGTFGGGIYFAVKSPNLQFGAYANNQFGKGDTNQSVSKSLVGLHFQAAFSAVHSEFQVDALASYMSGDPNGSKGEYGGGISSNMIGPIIVGVAVFSGDGGWSVTSYGVTLSPAMPGAPTIFLGATRHDGKFIMQTSFPIGTSN
jgi:hypothetical protein